MLSGPKTWKDGSRWTYWLQPASRFSLYSVGQREVDERLCYVVLANVSADDFVSGVDLFYLSTENLARYHEGEIIDAVAIFPLEVNRTFESEKDEEGRSIVGKVTKTEQIVVPAGKFDCFRIEVYYPQEETIIYWFSYDVGWYVKVAYGEHTVSELINYDLDGIPQLHPVSSCTLSILTCPCPSVFR